MTNRYDLLIASIIASNKMIVMMALFAVAGVAGYLSLNWVHPVIRRAVQWIYLAFLLALDIFVTVFFGRQW